MALSDEYVHVLYVDPNDNQQRGFRERFPDLPLRFSAEIPEQLAEVCAAVVIDHELLQKQALPTWPTQRYLVTTFQPTAPENVYRLTDGPAERFAVRSFMETAVKRLDSSFASVITRVHRASEEAVAHLAQARADLGLAISHLGKAAGKR